MRLKLIGLLLGCFIAYAGTDRYPTFNMYSPYNLYASIEPSPDPVAPIPAPPLEESEYEQPFEQEERPEWFPPEEFNAPTRGGAKGVPKGRGGGNGNRIPKGGVSRPGVGTTVNKPGSSNNKNSKPEQRLPSVPLSPTPQRPSASIPGGGVVAPSSRRSLRVHCYSCTSLNASNIVAGAGVDPGVFLSTIALPDVPVTARCLDPFEKEMTVRAGASQVVCDDGLCVKINYTDRHTAGDRCYSCTTLDADELLREVQDADWRRWLANIRNVPRTDRCGDAFQPEDAIRAGSRSAPCDGGVCMKMWFRERGGQEQVWRSCIPAAKGQVKSDCTRISSGEGDMEVCTCEGGHCNGGNGLASIMPAYFCFTLLQELVTVPPRIPAEPLYIRRGRGRPNKASAALNRD